MDSARAWTVPERGQCPSADTSVRIGDGGQWGNMQGMAPLSLLSAPTRRPIQTQCDFVLRGGRRLVSANTMGPTRVQNGTKDWPQTFESLAPREAGTKE